MKKFKKAFISVLSIVLVAVLSIGGTLAYLTSEDSDVNVMTMGNVKIEQLEYERVLDENEKPTKVIKEFTQAKPLYPYVGELGWANEIQTWEQINAPGKYQMFSMENVQDKIVFVKNTGKSDAYVRTWIALEQGSLSDERMWDIIGINVDDTNYTWSQEKFQVEIDGNKYLVMSATYNHILEPGEFTHASLAQVYLSHEATNEDVEAIDGNNNGTYDILVLSQAVQTSGFANADEALNRAFGTEEPWDEVVIPCVITSKEQFATFLKEGGNCVLGTNIEYSDSLGNSWTPVPSIKRDIILNTNGYELKTSAPSNSNWNMFITVGKNGKLTLGGKGSVNQTDQATSKADNAAIYSYSNSVVTINGGKYHSAGSTHSAAIWAEGTSVVTINDGTFTNEGTESSLIFATQDAVIYIKGGKFKTSSQHENDLLNTGDHSPNARIIVSGGTFINVDPSTPRSGDEGRVVIADGYKVISEKQTNGDTWYIVVPK